MSPRKSTVLLALTVVLLGTALGSLLVALTHLDHVRIGRGGEHAADTHAAVDGAARLLLKPFLDKDEHIPRDKAALSPLQQQQQQQQQQLLRQQQQQASGTLGPVQVGGLVVRGGGEAMQLLARTYALIPIMSERSRMVHIDYTNEWKARRDEYPEHTFVFAMHITYPRFIMPWPRFISDHDEQEFRLKEYTNRMMLETEEFCTSNEALADPDTADMCKRRTGREYIYFQHAQTEGTVEILANVSVAPHECGWMTTPKNVRPLAPREKPEHYKIASLDVPEGCSFQHFFDGVVPKMVQAMPLLTDEEVKLQLPACAFSPMVYEFLRFFGISQDRIIHPAQTSAQLYYSFCDAPGWNPVLWREMRRLLGVDMTIPLAERRRIVYLQRNTNAHNGGRRVANEVELLDAIREIAPGFEIVTFDSALVTTPEATRDYFRYARFLIGPHGGAFYNMMYCGADAVNIEFVPSATHFFLFSQMSHMLDQQHWFMHLPEDGLVDINNVKKIIQLELAPKR